MLVSCSETRTEFRVLHRSACEVCHRPLDESQTPNGIEDAHPWAPVQCVDCHGGQAYVCSTGIVLYTADGPQCDGEWVYDINESHVLGPEVRGLSSQQLDALDPAYLRFVNPGDPRIASFGCGGAGSDGGCHTPAVERMNVSPMRHIAGVLSPMRRRGGREGTVGTVAMLPDGTGDCALTGLMRLAPEAIDLNSSDPTYGPTLQNVVDHVLSKSCGSCHLDRFGSAETPGLHRSSGCSACHSSYAEDGLSRSTDPWVDKTEPSHPVTHALAAVPQTQQCATCHHYSEAVALTYQGIRRAGADEPSTRLTLGRPLYGLDEAGHIVDEDTTNTYDETPPDVHFLAGMHCADCHTASDAHGPSNATERGSCAVSVKCVDCHGTIRTRATPVAHLPRLQTDSTEVSLKLAIGGDLLRVPQLVDAIDPESQHYNPLAAEVMGPRSDGRSHTDDIACQTCHAAWVPSTYGQFATVDLGKEQASEITGILTAGEVTISPGRIATNDLVLGLDTAGKLRPTVPSGRWFYTLLPPSSAPGIIPKPVFETVPLSHVQNGLAVARFGQRPVDPHTTTRRSGFAACNRCHSEGSVEAPLNDSLMNITFGIGSDRFVVSACNVEGDNTEISADTSALCSPENQVQYRLDALQSPTGVNRVLFEWGSLVDQDLIAKMKAVVVEGDAPILIPTDSNADNNSQYPPFLPAD